MKICILICIATIIDFFIIGFIAVASDDYDGEETDGKHTTSDKE